MSKGVFPGGDFPGPRSRQGLTSQCQDSRKIVEDYLWEGVAHIYVDLSASMQCWTRRSLPIPIQNPDCLTCAFFPRRFLSLLFGFHSLVVDLTIWWAGLHFSGGLNLLQQRQLAVVTKIWWPKWWLWKPWWLWWSWWLPLTDHDSWSMVMTTMRTMMIVAVIMAGASGGNAWGC